MATLPMFWCLTGWVGYFLTYSQLWPWAAYKSSHLIPSSEYKWVFPVSPGCICWGCWGRGWAIRRRDLVSPSLPLERAKLLLGSSPVLSGKTRVPQTWGREHLPWCPNFQLWEDFCISVPTLAGPPDWDRRSSSPGDAKLLSSDATRWRKVKATRGTSLAKLGPIGRQGLYCLINSTVMKLNYHVLWYLSVFSGAVIFEETPRLFSCDPFWK